METGELNTAEYQRNGEISDFISGGGSAPARRDWIMNPDFGDFLIPTRHENIDGDQAIRGGLAIADNKIKILIVDDFATMRRIIKNILRQAGYDNIVEADDGATALPKSKTDKIDLVIADCNMPIMTELDLLKAIRGDEGLTGIPFLVMTAEAQKDNIIEVVQFVVTNYVIKPFTPEVLRGKIEPVLSEE
jgi:two-component system chemotaxis response regulator CheY